MVFVIFYIGVVFVAVLSIALLVDTFSAIGQNYFSSIFWFFVPLLWVISAGVGKYIGI